MNEERNRGEVSRARCGIVETRAREGEALRARDGQPRPLNPRGGRPPPAIPTETASLCSALPRSAPRGRPITMEFSRRGSATAAADGDVSDGLPSRYLPSHGTHTLHCYL